MLERSLRPDEAEILFRAGSLGKATADDLAKADVATDERDKDFLRVSAIMCHAGGRNNNGDGFLEGDLKWALQEYGIFQPGRPGILDDGHDRFAYGAWTEAFGVQHRRRFAIQTEGVIWAWRFPEFAEHVKRLYDGDRLWFSMLTRYGFGQCSECGKRFSPDAFFSGAVCEHMSDRRKSGATRWLREPVFLTSSRVDHPADEDAEGLGLAAASDAGGKELVVPTTAEEFGALSHGRKVELYYTLRDMAPAYWFQEGP